jgi:hypothetical protein
MMHGVTCATKHTNEHIAGSGKPETAAPECRTIDFLTTFAKNINSKYR